MRMCSRRAGRGIVRMRACLKRRTRVRMCACCAGRGIVHVRSVLKRRARVRVRSCRAGRRTVSVPASRRLNRRVVMGGHFLHRQGVIRRTSSRARLPRRA